MQGPVRIVDAEALAQGVEAIALAGEHLAGERQRVGELPVRLRGRRVPGEPQLDVEERHVERRVVDDPLGAARELQELGCDIGEFRLALEVVPGLAMHHGGARVYLALGVDVELDRAAGRAPVDDFDPRNFDDPVALLRVEAGGFRVEDDLAHQRR